MVHLGHEILQAYCVRGFNWRNRRKELINHPYGKSLSFSIIGTEEKFDLSKIIELEGVQSPHVGPFPDPGIVTVGWGPYMLLKDKISIQNKQDWIQKLLLQSCSPYSFHVSLIRSIFPNCTTISNYALVELGEEKLRKVFSKTLEFYPERFYTIIDREGRSHFLSDFRDLSKIENNPSFVIDRKNRLVLDTVWYIVFYSLLNNKDGESFHIGSGMYNYLINNNRTKMYYQRNCSRLFNVLKKLFGLNYMQLNICHFSQSSFKIYDNIYSKIKLNPKNYLVY